MPKRVLIAFDKFKDALTAEQACAICSREIRRAHPDWMIESAPLTDGGEGFCRILTELAGGTMHSVPASGPRLEAIDAPVGLLETSRLPGGARSMLFSEDDTEPTRTAVIEMAAVSGLAMLAPDSRDPWKATSYGTGQLIRAASEMGAGLVLLGIGGSATSDLGLGALNAMGLEFRTNKGAKVRPPTPETWDHLASIDGEIFSSIPPIAIACDVSNPLLGPEGAAAVYGPQKGLRSQDLPRHEELAGRLARMLCAHRGTDPEKAMNQPGTGAAGGISFGLMVACGARLVPGFDLVAAWLDLDRKVAHADLVITGEGRFDRSSLSGKGPGTILSRAREAGKEVLVFAGAIDAALANDPTLKAITPPGTPLAVALADAGKNLAHAVAQNL